MMSTLELIRNKRQDIMQLALECGLHNIRVFGSVARQEEQAHSDVDILADYDEKSGKGLAVFSFPTKVEALIGRKVDLVFEKGLYHQMRDAILEEAQPL